VKSQRCERSRFFDHQLGEVQPMPHPFKIVSRLLLAGIAMTIAFAIAVQPSTAETVKLGLLKVIADAPIFLAQEKGYFAAEGLTVELQFFNSGGEPIAVAVASGDLDLAYVGLTGGLYNLAGQGALRIVAGTYREAPGFHIIAYLASNRAFASGLKSLKDLPGHSLAVTQIGAFDYDLSRLAEKYGFEQRSIHLLPLQSIPNVVSAVSGGQADAGMTTATAAIPLVDRGGAKLLGWVGDETPLQMGVIAVGTKTLESRRDMVGRFLRAYRHAARDYHDAFTGGAEARRDGPEAPAILAVTSKYLGLPSAQIAAGLAYVDADARLDVRDVRHQLAWFESQGMVKNAPTIDKMIDSEFVVPLN
jgi:NitT/TauT family transport system substrate-binding protein